jgi:hypothetical protein
MPRGSKFYHDQFQARLKSNSIREETDLHVTHSNAIITAIPHDLIFDLLPPLHALLHEHLRARRERLTAQGLELRLILREARAKSAKRIRSAHDDRVPNFRRRQNRLVYSSRRRTLRALFSDLFHRSREELSVFRRDDSLDRRAEYLYPKRRKLVFKLDADIERRLSAKGNVDPGPASRIG